MGIGTTSAGAGLRLGIYAWIRRQDLLRSVYRRIPQRWRDRVSARLEAGLQKRLCFTRTPAWGAPLPDVEWPAVPHENAGTRTVGIPGVNIIGFIRGQFGLGENARAYACALIGAGVPVSLYDVDIELAHGRDDHSLDAWINEDLPYSVSMVFVNPDVWRLAMEKINRARLQGHHVIACWFWELERLPEHWVSTIAEVDEIMVSAGFVEQAFRRVTDKPILRVPHPLSNTPDSGLQRKDFGLPDDKFVFLASFDFNSSIARKNPYSVIEAFGEAFPRERKEVRLLIKTSGGLHHQENLLQLLAAAAVDDRIIVRDDIIDRAHVKALQRCCDAYVSLHRAEGLGLGMAECMALGKPVIATAWSGNMEFMDETNSCLVGFRLIDVKSGEYYAGECQRWADPDVGMAAMWMRRLVDEPGLAQQIGARAREVSFRLSPQNTGVDITARLARLMPEQNWVIS